MWNIARRNLWANKSRLSLTALAIVLGVGFVVASFVLSDSLRDSFGTLAKEITGGTDLVVRPTDDFGSDVVVDDALVARAAALPGVRAAYGTLDADLVQPVKDDGKPIETVGPPLIGFAWVDDADLNQLTVVDGNAPTVGQFIMDIDSADRHGFNVGQTYTVITATGSRDFTLSGLGRFGESNSLNGATLTGYDESDMRRMVDAPVGTWEEIVLALDGTVDGSTIQQQLQQIVPTGLEVINQQTLEQEQAASFNEAIGIIEKILLGFSAVSLLVSTFMIYNTFGIVLAQRVREIGLLRAVGAEVRQVRRSVIGESALVGFIASVLGIFVGIGLTFGLRSLFSSLGAPLPETKTIVSTATIVIALLVGVGVTVISSVAPARRAGRVTPIAAMGDAAAGSTESQSRRLAAGAGLTGLGIAMVLFGLFITESAMLTVSGLGVGAIAVFLGVALLSPAVVGPVTTVIGWPIKRVFGVSGNLAQQNAARNPRRTATTAGALMIGLALVTTALVVGESLKAEVNRTLDESVQADYVIASQNFDPFPSRVADDLEAVPELGFVMPAREVAVEFADEQRELTSVNFDRVEDLFFLDIVEGSLGDGSDGGLALPTSIATELDVQVGDEVDVRFGNGAVVSSPINAFYNEATILEGGLIDLAFLDTVDPSTSFDWIGASVAGDATAAAAASALAVIGDTYPQLAVQSKAEYRESVEGQIDQILSIVNAMLGLAIFIALLGIGLTLALSVFERTRELGLLRAVGMTRRQMRRMVRWEAAVVAVFGAVLGIVIGLGFGAASVVAIPDSFTSTVAIPYLRLALVVGIAGAAGLLAALFPARRAGVLSVLDAIAT